MGAGVLEIRHERELLCYVGSSSRQFQSVSAGRCGLAGTLTGRLEPEYRSEGSHAGAFGEEILHQTRDLERVVLEAAAQKKADTAPPVCPVCGNKLSRITQGHERELSAPFREGADSAGPGVVPPFTLVIELDAWNLRERNEEQWGRSEALRQVGAEPAWWHWVYGGTCFRLSQRVQTAGGARSC